MTIDPREKVVLFIDGANLYATSKAIGIDIDYRRLLAEFQSKAYLLRALRAALAAPGTVTLPHTLAT